MVKDSVDGKGFVLIKMTALANPRLLSSLSEFLVWAREYSSGEYQHEAYTGSMHTNIPNIQFRGNLYKY